MFENLQGFFESTLGQIITVLVILVLLTLILIPSKESKSKRPDTKALTISALLVALAIGLGQIKIWELPQGGAVTLFSMLAVVLCGYLLGTRRGVMAGICVGLLNLIFGPYVIHPVQLLMDYPFAFGALGLSGIFRHKKNGLVKGYIVGILGKYLCSVLSGIIFFGSYVPDGINIFAWSFGYNIIYTAIEGIATIILISLPPVKKALEGLKKQM